MKTFVRRIVFAAVVLLMSPSCFAQSNVYSVTIYSAGTSYRDICCIDFPFFPYHYKITERQRYEDANGRIIIDVGRGKARGGILHRYLDFEIGSERFTVLIEPLPPKSASTEAPNQITGANSRRAGQLDGRRGHNVVVAVASALPAAVAQLYRLAK
jgi:hypothetical protein